MLMFFKRKRKNQKGFTLTELIVVVAILGVLAAVATPLIQSQINNARNNTDEANARTLENAIKRAVARDALTLGAAVTATTIEAAIDDEITVMTCENTTNHFYVNVTTGVVQVAAADPDGATTVWQELVNVN